MMPNSCGDRPVFRAASRGALALGLLLCAAACDTTYPATDGGAPFVLATHGDPVRANSPPGIEVTLGNKLVLQAGAPSGLD
jgi:hypothetical protein